MSDSGPHEKGANIYIQPARILNDNGGHTAPIVQCQGQAIELALKAYLSERAIRYPEVHDLDALLDKCTGLIVTTEERETLINLNKYYFRKDGHRFPSRYRKTSGDVWTPPGQQHIENIVAAILKQRRIDR